MKKSFCCGTRGCCDARLLRRKQKRRADGQPFGFDSLSYSLGANIGYGMSYEMKDIPFDFKLVDKGIKEGAMGKASQEHDKSLDMLREYFMSKRGERAQAIAEKRAAADSVRLAGGDSTKVEYPAADPEMFERRGAR